MASIGHVVVGMAAARAHARPARSTLGLLAAMVGWSALSLSPDIDVIGFRYGVAYGAPWGHRGATHSLAMAGLLGILAFALSRSARTALFVCATAASHGLLDTLTQGGLGCALLWPFSHERFLAPVRVVPAAPIGIRFFSLAGLRVALLELAWCWPLLLYALWPRRKNHLEPRGEREL